MRPLIAADPYVLKANGRYYLYATAEENGVFQVRVSDNLLHWSAPKTIFRAGKDFWGKDCFWAPECHVIDGQYYLFFSANRKDSDALESFAITCVRCDTPDGEFEDFLQRPIFVADYPTIDGNILVEDGHIYLYYSRCCFEHNVNGLEESWIYGVELKRDLTGIIGEPQLLLKPEQEWEGRSAPTTGRRWNEGSYIIKEGGCYYIMYSANFYMERHYAMGYAVGMSPMGPFAKAAENPIAECTEEITGTGHGCLVRTDEGLMAVYHGRTAATGEARVGFAAQACIKEGKLSIDVHHAAMMMESDQVHL